MAYMRGSYYICRGNGLFIHGPKIDGSIPMKLFDELVAMRWAQLPVSAKKVVEQRAINKYQGNIGCDALCKKYGKLGTVDLVMRSIKKKVKKSS